MSKMNLGSQSISGESECFGDYRYQKALKQISKLINVNRQIKLQSERFRQQNQQLQNRMQQLIQQNANQQNNIQLLSNEYQKLSQEYVVLQDYCKKAEYEQRQYMENSQMQTKQKEQIHRRHLQQIEELSGRFNEQMSELVLELQDKDEKIQQLQVRMGQMKELQQHSHMVNENYQIILKENYQLKQQNEELRHKIQLLNSQVTTITLKINKKPDEQLLNKLKINQEWIKSLNEQNYNLKQKVLQEQYKKQREKCNQTIFHDILKHAQSSLISQQLNSPAQLLMKDYIKQAQKKVKKLQEQKNKLNDKYTKLKSLHRQLQIQNSTLEKEVNLLVVKVNGYEHLTQRQQTQIQFIIEEYNQQMHKLILKSSHNHTNTNTNVNANANRSKSKSKNNSQKIGTHNNSQRKDNNDHQHAMKLKQLNVMIQSLSQQVQRLHEELQSIQLELQHSQRELQHSQRELQHSQGQSQQKSSLIQYLQEKISALQQQRGQIIKTYHQLEQQLQSYQKSSPQHYNNSFNSTNNPKPSHQYINQSLYNQITSPNQKNDQTILKTHSVSKNGNKVFEINGKKYQTVVLKNNNNNNNLTSKPDQSNNSKATHNHISSPKTYGNTNQNLIHAQRA